MKNFTTRRIAIAVCFTLVMTTAQMALSARLCSQLFSTVVKTLDEKYSEAVEKAKNESQRIFQSVPLLREAFTPLINDFQAVVDQQSDPQLRALIQKANSNVPVFKGVFSDEGAQVPQILRGTRIKFDSQYVISANASQLEGRYSPKNSPDLVRASEQLYGFPDRLAVQKMGLLHNQLGVIVTPVGAYGPEFARAMYRTTQIMMDLAFDKLAESSAKVHQKSPHLIEGATSRGQSATREQAHPDMTPLSSAVEGILTLHQLTNELLLEKIDGIQDGATALEALIQSGTTPIGLISEITMQMPIGFVGPASLMGYGFKKPLTLLSDGKVVMSENLNRALDNLRKKGKEKGLIKGVCPMAGLLSKIPVIGRLTTQKSGIQTTAELYLRVFKQVQAEEAAKN